MQWKRLDNTKVVKIGFRTVVRKYFELPSGLVQEFTTYDSEGRQHAGCIALTADNKVISGKQFRPGPEQIMYEILGGGVEVGEDLETAALREFREESGYKPGKIKLLGTICKDAYTNSTHTYYLFTDCIKVGDQSLESTEFIEIELLTIDDFLSNAMRGKMTDLEAVLLAYDELKLINEVKP